jgi:hypothetical protein
MSTYVKAGLAAATALALICAPALSAAAPSSSIPWSASSLLAAGMLPSSSLLEAVNQSQPQTDIERVNARGSAFAPSEFALRSPGLGELQGRADLLLWNLCAVVRSHQKRHHFEAIDSGFGTVHISEEIDKISAVPLPGAVWLFVVGLMGLAGTRVTGIKRGKAGMVGTDDQRAWLSNGAATPA